MHGFIFPKPAKVVLLTRKKIRIYEKKKTTSDWCCKIYCDLDICTIPLVRLPFYYTLKTFYVVMVLW